ncbi:MAG: hypothetical protein ACI311_01630 [Bacilli bacterium]
MIKILISMIVVISSIVYVGDIATLNNINCLFVEETKNIVKKCVLATDDYQPYFNVNLLNTNIDKYVEEKYSTYKNLTYSIEYEQIDLPNKVNIFISFKINLMTNFKKSVSYKITTNGRFINE